MMPRAAIARKPPLVRLRAVLNRLEAQAIRAGQHPVLIHEGLGALDELVARLDALEDKRDWDEWERYICGWRRKVDSHGR